MKSWSRFETRGSTLDRVALSHHASRITHHGVRGFTLVELVISIALASIVVAFAAMFILTPVQSYQAQTRRAELVDSTDAVLRLVARDVRSALPNSVRVMRSGTVSVLEVLNAVDAVRYRESGSTATAQELDFSSPDDSFASLSRFEAVTKRFDSTAYYLAIYNVGVPGADAYSSTSKVMTPVNTRITIDNSATPDEDVITMTPSFQFAYGSPARRVYLVSGPVKYLCNEGTNTIRRYTGYPIASTLTTAAPSGTGVTNALIANNIATCQFDYVTGTSSRAGLVTLRITLTKSGESIWLVHQVHVENAP